ncbi:hypothetical protein BDQ12DRAFT_452253 [Crucibulum laeve]|uniref:F-box domain-containing protein n=1 Tax=Crucibulum laeve TaxID=68775 RepID=A0A5C3LL34_9AGAR|nr:hypothetical protein BDQ12DRAFT_452253 [Crucibulum laeve]
MSIFKYAASTKSFSSKSSKTRKPASLLHLPNELLLQIILLLPRPLDRYRLSLVCRQLNAMVVPLQLGISDPSGTLEIDITQWASPRQASHFDPLFSLSTAMYLHSVESLTCRFRTMSDRSGYEPTDHLTWKLRRLSRFISRLSHVGSLKLVFDDETGPMALNSYGVWVYKTDVRLKQWAQILRGVLEGAITRGCTSLIVEHGSYMQDAYVFRAIPDLGHRSYIQFANYINLRRPAPHCMEGPGWQFYRRRAEGCSTMIYMTPPNSNICSTLQHLSIHSTILLLPPCLSWTIGLLRSSTSITSLSLGHLQFTSSEILDAVLPLIADAIAERLIELRILPCSFFTSARVLDFVATFPKLKSLYISDQIMFPPRSKRHPVVSKISQKPLLHFEHLEFLHASSGFMSYIHWLCQSPPITIPCSM